MDKDNVMVVNMTIGKWTGFRHDREATDQTTEAQHAQHGASRVNKRLLPKEAFKGVNAAAARLGQVHNFYTLPWGDDGSRLLPVRMFFKYTEAVNAAKDAYAEAASNFARAYPLLVVSAKEFLGDMYREEEYPPAEDVEHRFYASIRTFPMPRSGDFRVDVGEGELKKLQKELEAHTKEAVRTASAAVWERVRKIVEHIRDTLADPDKIFRNSMLEHAHEICEMLPELNITNDPRLDKMQKAILKDLGALDAVALRKDMDYRKESAAKADKLMTTLDKHIGAGAR